MRIRGSSRPSKATSMVAVVVGLGFIVIGVTSFIPGLGFFGWLWTCIAFCITGYHLFNIFSKNGIAEEVYSFEQGEKTHFRKSNSIEERLKQLDELKTKNIISDKEYEKQRSNILNSL